MSPLFVTFKTKKESLIFEKYLKSYVQLCTVMRAVQIIKQ